MLGPVIFSLFINDLALSINSGTLVLYADDSTIIVSGKTMDELESNLNKVCDEFSMWCNRNRLIINSAKTVAMQFYNRRCTNDMQILVNGATINFQESTKVLGVMVDANMGWKSHIEYVCGRLKSCFFVLLQLKQFLDLSTLKNIYYALAYSVISYNIGLWGAATSSNRVLILQKRLLRLIFNIGPRESCRPIFKDHNILTVPAIYIYKTIYYVRRNVTLHAVGELHNYSTRHGNHIRTEQHRTSMYKKNPTYAGMYLYNYLPGYIKQESEFGKFTKELKKFLLSNVFYSVDEYLSLKH